MKLSDEARAEAPQNGTARAPGEGAADDGLLQVLASFVEEAFASVNGLIEVKSDRVRLALRRTTATVIVAAGAGICAAFWLGAAALATLRGMRGGFSALCGGREWLGDLLGGLSALALAAAGVALFLKLSERRELVRLEAKYERIRNESGTSADHEPPSADGGAAARARGSAGDRSHP